MKSLIDRQVGTRIARMLQETQHKNGRISDADINRIADQLGEPVRIIQDVISFEILPEYQIKFALANDEKNIFKVKPYLGK